MLRRQQKHSLYSWTDTMFYHNLEISSPLKFIYQLHFFRFQFHLFWLCHWWKLNWLILDSPYQTGPLRLTVCKTMWGSRPILSLQAEDEIIRHTIGTVNLSYYHVTTLLIKHYLSHMWNDTFITSHSFQNAGWTLWCDILTAVWCSVLRNKGSLQRGLSCHHIVQCVC